jgi:hypothetical protein
VRTEIKSPLCTTPKSAAQIAPFLARTTTIYQPVVWIGVKVAGPPV